MKLYLAVTADKYELPLCVLDTLEELAKFAGVSVGAARQSIYNGYSGKYHKMKLISVCLDEEVCD